MGNGRINPLHLDPDLPLADYLKSLHVYLIETRRSSGWQNLVYSIPSDIVALLGVRANRLRTQKPEVLLIIHILIFRDSKTPNGLPTATEHMVCNLILMNSKNNNNSNSNDDNDNNYNYNCNINSKRLLLYYYSS